MDLGPHAAFIVIAYGLTALIVGALMTWVTLDHRQQTRALADLEARGLVRRSERGAAVSGQGDSGELESRPIGRPH